MNFSAMRQHLKRESAAMLAMTAERPIAKFAWWVVVSFSHCFSERKHFFQTLIFCFSVCLDRRFFQSRYMGRALCAKKRCNNATTLDPTNNQYLHHSSLASDQQRHVRGCFDGIVCKILVLFLFWIPPTWYRILFILFCLCIFVQVFI